MEFYLTEVGRAKPHRGRFKYYLERAYVQWTENATQSVTCEYDIKRIIELD